MRWEIVSLGCADPQILGCKGLRKKTRQGWWEINLICDHQNLLGGGFKYFLFSSLPVEMIQFD